MAGFFLTLLFGFIGIILFLLVLHRPKRNS
jgi:hypothetical protein